jgi:hypothetical protein
MTLVLLMIFNILVALALGFVFGRIYQIRRDALERRDGFSSLDSGLQLRPFIFSSLSRA